MSINAVKRFVADLDLSSDTPYVPELKKKKLAESNPEMDEKIHNLVFHGKTKK